MSQKNKPSIFIAAAGTGGHLFSAERIAKNLQQKGCKVTFVGKGLRKNPFFQKMSFSFVEISSAPLCKGPRFFKSFLFLSAGFVKSLFLLCFKKVDCVVGFGSYHTFPFLLAAKILRKKTVLFEANCLVGQVNKIIASKRNYLACQFPLANVPQGKRIIRVLSFPFKPPLDSPSSISRTPTLLIFGGSQGAQVFNQKLPSALAYLKEQGVATFKVFHIAGSDEGRKKALENYEKEGIEAQVFSFYRDMETLYRKATIVICRAGALTISELIFYQKPAILIPYPYAKDDHQTINAEFFQRIGGGVLLSQKSLFEENLSQAIKELLVETRNRKCIQCLAAYQEGEKQDLTQLILNL